MMVWNVPIGTAVAAHDTTEGETVLLLVNEAIDHKEQGGSILSVNQMQVYGIDVDYCLTIFNRYGKPGRSSLIADGHEIDFQL